MNKRQRKKMENKITERYDYICDITSHTLITRSIGNTYLRNKLLRIIKDKKYKPFKDLKRYFGGQRNDIERKERQFI